MKTFVPRAAGVSLLVLALSACGGGGGGGGGDGVKPIPKPPSEPTPMPPAPPPPPPPSPPSPPLSGNFNSQEYQNSFAAVQANAIEAYEKGATGQGIVAAVIEGPLALNNQFTGRIHAASADLVGSRGIFTQEGNVNHATAVASVMAAAKDDSGMHGMAFNSTLLMLRIDSPYTACPSQCEFTFPDIAKGIDAAVQNNARVINISMGFNVTFTNEVIQAIDKATAAGVVIVFSAGNSGAPEAAKSTLVATKPEARGTVIIAGATNNAGTDLASFSNRAGTGAEFYLAALGEGVQVYSQAGAPATVMGTSFSAPAIAGAVALLAHAFPNLTGQQIVNLLLTTATDMGTPGADAVYGRGRLNLTKAFSPQGTMSLAGSMAPLSLTSNGALSPAMGDATGDLKGAVFLDSYSRAYEADLSLTVSRPVLDKPLHAALDGSYSTNSAVAGALAVSITTNGDHNRPTEARLQQMELSHEQAQTAKAVAATATARLSAQTEVAMGLSEGGRDIQQRLSGKHGTAFLVARDPLAGTGFHARARTSVGLRHEFGQLGVTMTTEGGQVYGSFPLQGSQSSRYRTTSLIVERRLGRFMLGLGGSQLDEGGSILGGLFSPAFSSAGSKSWFADGAASLLLGRGWSADATYRHGWTSVREGDGLVTGGRLSSAAFGLDLAKTAAFIGGDKLAFRLMQPLRVKSGGFDVNLPISYDYSSGAVGYQPRLFNLAPTGREMNYEVSYRMGVLGGSMATHAFLRTDPGHIHWMKNDLGGALRFTLGF